MKYEANVINIKDFVINVIISLINIVRIFVCKHEEFTRQCSSQSGGGRRRVKFETSIYPGPGDTFKRHKGIR